MKLIIGKNSKIIKQIEISLADVDLISHNEICNKDLDSYSHIYLFAWSYDDVQKNIDLVNQIPKEKLIFISSTAVFSLQERRQWNNYPNSKQEVEEIVKKNDSIIVRLGVVDSSLRKKIFGPFPFTTLKMIIEIVNNPPSKKIVNLFTIEEGALNPMLYFLQYIFLCFEKILFAPIFAKYLQGIQKLLNLWVYGYTLDMTKLFFLKVKVGHGALGSRLAPTSILTDKIIVSWKPNKVLNKRGFNGTRVGRDLIGLSKF